MRVCHSRILCVIAALVLLLGMCPESAQARTLAQVSDRGAFTICAYPEAEPYSSQTDQSQGVQIDLARAIARELGVRLDISWILFRRDARHVGCDALMGSIVDEDEEPRPKVSEGDHAKPIRFAATAAYARQTTRIVVRRSDAARVTSLGDLRSMTVAVSHASVAHQILYQAGIPVQTRYPTEGDILDAVVAGKVQAGVVNDWVYGWYVKTHPAADLQQLTALVVDPQLDFDVGITLRNTDRPLLDRVNGILDRFARDGVLARIFRDYGSEYHAPTSR